MAFFFAQHGPDFLLLNMVQIFIAQYGRDDQNYGVAMSDICCIMTFSIISPTLYDHLSGRSGPRAV